MRTWVFVERLECRLQLALAAPLITSDAEAIFNVGAAGTFTVTTTGNPIPAITESGALPANITLHDNGNNTATLAGTPAAGTGGVYLITLTAHSAVNPDATQYFGLDVFQATAITSADHASFPIGTGSSFIFTTTGFPAADLAESGALPSGVIFTNNNDGTATLSGMPAAGTAGVYDLSITTNNGGSSTTMQSFALSVAQAPTVTSASSTAFTVGSPGTFTLTAAGFPAVDLSEKGTLPTGVTFVNNNNSTATLSGTPAAGTSGVYNLTINTDNGISPAGTQSFALEIDQPTTITSAATTIFPVGAASSFTFTTAGYPLADLAESGALPAGVTFTNNNDGTATLAGTPAAAAAGNYNLTITTSNGSSSTATQAFTLDVAQPAAGFAPIIAAVNSSGGSSSWAVQSSLPPGAANVFDYGVASFKAILGDWSGDGIDGIGEFDPSTGTWYLRNSQSAGSPDAVFQFGAPGWTPVSGDWNGGAADGIGVVDPSTETWYLRNTASTGPADYAPFVFGAPGWIPVTGDWNGDGTTGIGVFDPSTATFYLRNSLSTGAPDYIVQYGAPGWEPVTGDWSGSGVTGIGVVNPSTETWYLRNTPSTGPAQIAPFVFGAAGATFLGGQDLPRSSSVSSANATTFTARTAGTFTLTTAGNPLADLAETGTLPTGVTFVNNNDSTATLSGTPAAGTGGVYPFTVSADNGTSPAGSQAFTLTVDEASSISSTDDATFLSGTPDSFTITTTGFPDASITAAGSLPSGVTLVDNTDGTATLAGDGTEAGGVYPITLNATDGIGTAAQQTFTLTVNHAPSFTSADAASFVINTPGTFNITTAGFPKAAISLRSKGLPKGMAFQDNGDGTATISGKASAGTYQVTLGAANGITPDAMQTLTITARRASKKPAPIKPIKFTTPSQKTLKVGASVKLTIAAAGSPLPTVTTASAPPPGLTLATGKKNALVLTGKPTAYGTFVLALTASNGVASVTQNLTLTIQGRPVFTSTNNLTVDSGGTSTFVIATQGFPTAAILFVGKASAGLSLHDNGDGTATFSSLPTQTGSYPITLIAKSRLGATKQVFTLNVVNSSLLVSSATAADVDSDLLLYQ